MREHEYDQNSEVVMAIRNTTIDAGTTILKRFTAEAVKDVLEELLTRKQYMGDPLFDPDKRHVGPYVWANDVHAAIAQQDKIIAEANHD